MNEPHKYIPELGKLITGEAQRDAVHIAVAPMIACEMLRPGQHVAVEGLGAYPPTHNTPCVGVVDPYLRRPVMPGQKFWLFVYPGTITGLRHEWTHPALDEETT